MGIYSEAPPYRTFSDDKPTLLVCWWCTLFAATIILFRVCGRYIRTEKLFPEDWLAFACLIPLFIRMGFVHMILLWGTNNSVAPQVGWTDVERRHRELGSRLVLASRIFYAATLWMLKMTISEFFKRLILQIWKRSYEHMLRGIRWFLLATFVAVIISDLTECRPVTHYWLVEDGNSPVQPECRQGFAQLITMGTCNVITDLLLVVFPIPIIIKSQMTLKRKVQLVLLFSLSIVPVGITLYRIPNIINSHGVQQYRSVWASVDILLATGVANALVLGSFVRDRGVKKVKWRAGSTSDSIERTSTRRATTVQMHWGSDEDLVRGMSIALEPGLREGQQKGARPAPMALSGGKPLDHITEGWTFPSGSEQRERRISDIEIGPYRDIEPYVERQTHSTSETSITTPSRKVSFFDIGGLLDDDPLDRQRIHRQSMQSDGTSTSPSIVSHDLSPTSTRKGSHALLQDVGGLLAPSTPRSTPRGSARPWKAGTGGDGLGFELQSIPQDRELGELSSRQHGTQGAPIARTDTTMSLQDVGGLLK